MKDTKPHRACGHFSIAQLSTSAFAQDCITFKSAKTGSSYYQMSVQIAEAMRKGTDGGVVVTVEESQGSVLPIIGISCCL